VVHPGKLTPGKNRRTINIRAANPIAKPKTGKTMELQS
jgi:hypothetical protein